MFVIPRLQKLARKKQIPLYVCFIDLTKAYDFVCGSMTGCARDGSPVEQGLRQRCVLAPLLFNIFFAADINVTYKGFKADEDIMDAFGAPEEEKGGGGAGESNCRRTSPGDATLGYASR